MAAINEAAEANQAAFGASPHTSIWLNADMLNISVDDESRNIQIAGSEAHARIRDLLLAEGYPDPGLEFTFGLKSGKPSLFGVRDSGGHWNSTPPTAEIAEAISNFFALRD